MPLLTPERVSRTIEAVFALLALFFVAMAAGALLAPDLGALHGWLGLPVGLGAGLVLFTVAALAPRRSSKIAFDEGYQAEWLRAQAAGYWAFIFAFAIGGNLVALGVLPIGRAFMTTAMGAAAVPFVLFLARRWIFAR